MTRALPKLALVLAWLVTISVTMFAPAGPAKAAAPELQATLTGLKVTGRGDQATLELSGTVTNNGTEPAFGVRSLLWRSRDPLQEHNAFGSVLAGDNDPWGVRLNNRPEHSFWITQPSDRFDPGSSAAFTVRGTLADLGFTADGTIYLLGVQVMGTADGSGNFVELARARTFYVTTPTDSLPLTSLVLLAATPTKVRPGVFANESLVGELTGRLDTLVGAAARPGMSWLVDPALIDEVRDLADGYAVLDGEGTRDGTGQQAAADWLAKFEALPETGGARTLFAAPDLLGAERNQDAGAVTRALQADTTEDLDDLPLLVLPHLGVASGTLPAMVADADPDAMLVSTAGRGPVLARGPNGSALLRLAPATTAAGPTTDDGPIQRQQRQYAEAILGGGLLRLISTVDQASADAAMGPSWLERTSIADLLDAEPDPAATLVLPEKTSTLPDSRFKQIATTARDFERYQQLVPNSAVVTEAPATLARMASSWWIGSSAAGRWFSAVGGTVSRQTVTDAITLTASARVLMSSRTNEFPISVTNRLSEPIQVRIAFSSDNPQRISIATTELLPIPAGQTVTVNVRPQASSNGLVNVTAELQTQAGVDVGRSARIAVEVTDLGMIGWIIVIVSGVVLVAATALRIRQVRRKNKEGEA